MDDESKRGLSEILISLLFWPVLLCPNAKSGEVVILCLFGAASWLTAFIFGTGFLISYLLFAR